jgi:ferredoxin/flavodoxin---NADP+ reductase
MAELGRLLFAGEKHSQRSARAAPQGEKPPMNTAQDKFFRARITQRADFSEDLWMIRVDPGGEFHFIAGQYATLGVQTPQKLVERPYSIVSSPYEKEVEFFLELVPHGELTPLLYKLHVGDEFTFRKVAKGRFTLDIKSGRTNHLLLCTVTGIAPYVSYTRTLYKDWKDGKFAGEHKLFLIEGASRSWEFGYHDEMMKYAAEVPWLIYIPTISRPWEDPNWKGETGRVDDLIRKYTDMWGLTGQNTTAYLCGHPTMIENGKGILYRRGWTKEAMKEEVYFIVAKEAKD